MKYVIFILILSTFVSAGALADCGDLPTWRELHMSRDNYFYLSGLSGLICGSIFSFMITR
jgi:hypothetical protein